MFQGYYQNKALGSKVMLDYYVRKLTDAAEEPLEVAEVVVHKRIDLGLTGDTTEEDYIKSLITAARVAVEDMIGKPIGEQEFELGLTHFPCGWILELPRFPLISVETIKYTKLDGTVVTWYDSTASPVVDPSAFTIEDGSEPGAIFLKPTIAWPSDIMVNGFPLKIRFKAGMTDIPAPVLQAIRFMFAHFYQNREPVTDGRVTQPFAVPLTVDDMLREYKYEAFS